MLKRILFAFLLTVLPNAVAAEGRTIIVLDASGSMWGQIEGRAKIEIARDTLGTVLESVPEDNELGLVVYGHRSRGDCSDIEVAVQPGAGTAQTIIDFANSASPLGKTPLTDAVRQAAEAMRLTEEKATVILVTDGLETCEADPCALGAELEATAVDFTAHVVGFGLTAEEGQQVACLAEATGGLYLPAADAASLGEALTRTVVAQPVPEPEPTPEPQPAAVEFNLFATVSLGEDSPDITDGRLRWDLFPVSNGQKAERAVEGSYRGPFQVNVPAGDYVLAVRYGTVRSERSITLTETETMKSHFVLDAAIVKLAGRRVAGMDPENGIRVDVTNGEARDGGYGTAEVIIPAGQVTISARHAGAEVSETISLRGGDVVEKELFVNTGVVYPIALYAEGGPQVESNSIRFDVVAPRPSIDGSRQGFGGTYGTDLVDVPAGEYVLQSRIDEVLLLSESFTVEAGQRSDITVVLDAGVAAFTASGADRISVIPTTADINGRRDEIAGGYGETFQVTLPAGAYAVSVRYGGDKPIEEKPFEVAAGERVEVAVP